MKTENQEKLSKMWVDFKDADSSILRINGVEVATVQQGDDSNYCIYTYDSDWSQIFINNFGKDILDDFETMDEAKRVAETVFIMWLFEVCQIFDLSKPQ